jgi:drug/metabolite transporter (DMT)-like permease
MFRLPDLLTGENIQTVRSNALLLITAIIWGFAFVAQRVGMEYLGPFTFIMSMEAVFAAIGGWLLLNEILSMRGLMGCGLMLCGMLISQLWPNMNKAPASVSD